MDRYYLVATYNDKGNFINEKIIKLEGINTIEGIDNFTSKYTYTDLFRKINDEYGLDGQNVLTITKGDGIFYPVAYDSKDIEEFSLKVNENKLVDRDFNFYKLYGDLFEIIKARDYNTLKKLFGENSNIYHDIYNYLNCDMFEESELNRLQEKIINAFSKYINLRKFIIKRQNQRHVLSPKPKVEKKKTLEEYEEEYLIDHSSNISSMYDDLEFLNEEELSEMGYSR